MSKFNRIVKSLEKDGFIEIYEACIEITEGADSHGTKCDLCGLAFEGEPALTFIATRLADTPTHHYSVCLDRIGCRDRMSLAKQQRAADKVARIKKVEEAVILPEDE